MALYIHTYIHTYIHLTTRTVIKRKYVYYYYYYYYIMFVATIYSQLWVRNLTNFQMQATRQTAVKVVVSCESLNLSQ